MGRITHEVGGLAVAGACTFYFLFSFRRIKIVTVGYTVGSGFDPGCDYAIYKAE